MLRISEVCKEGNHLPTATGFASLQTSEIPILMVIALHNGNI
jgi:hypothetical protein